MQVFLYKLSCHTLRKEEPFNAELHHHRSGPVFSVPPSSVLGILPLHGRLGLSCIAGVLGTTVEDLLINYWDEPLDEEENVVWRERHDDSSMLDFYMLVDSTMSKLSACGDMPFVKAICDDYWIERFYTAGFYRSAFFLLGLVDHLCKKHHKKLVSRFDAYR